MLNSLAGMSIPCFLMLYELYPCFKMSLRGHFVKKKKKKKMWLLYHENTLPAGKHSTNFFLQEWSYKHESEKTSKTDLSI